MAQVPDSTDIFIREVDENLRRDRTEQLARRYGNWAIAAVLLILAAVGGYMYWSNRQLQQSSAQSEQLDRIFEDFRSGKQADVVSRLARLETAQSAPIRAAALFSEAAIALQSGDRATAIAKYRQAEDDKGLPQPYRDIALLRLTTLEFDSLKPDEVIARMQPLAKPGEPYFGSAGELTAMAYLKQGRKAQAGQLFARIAADTQVPDTMRSRAVEIASTLGVDASASLPLTVR